MGEDGVCGYVCASVTVTALVSAMSPLKVKARYQQKALYAGNKRVVQGCRGSSMVICGWTPLCIPLCHSVHGCHSSYNHP